MNGRVYDPSLGRFLSSDPIIQNSGNSQNLNRYSYVMNSPMGYRDPSGYRYEGVGVTFYEHGYYVTVPKYIVDKYIRYNKHNEHYVLGGFSITSAVGQGLISPNNGDTILFRNPRKTIIVSKI